MTQLARRFFPIAVLFLAATAAHATALAPFIDLQEQGLTYVSDGEGLATWPGGGVNLDVNVGGTVRFALLYWSGVDTPCPQTSGSCTITQPAGDQEVTFAGNAITGTLIGSEEQAAAQINHLGYFADVTSLVAAAGTGPHTFAFADGDGANNLEIRSGVTLIVAYTNASDLATYRMIVWDGVDFASGSETGAAAQTTAVTFNHGTNLGTRSASLLAVAGEGSAALTDSLTISNNPTVADSLDASNGATWDNDLRTISIPAGVGTTTVQLAPSGASPDNFSWEVSVLRVAITDVTAPSCSYTVDNGPPKQVTDEIQDTESGIASIVVTVSNNADTVVPPFIVGTTSPVSVTSTKIDQSQAMHVTIQVTDVAGNVNTCDYSDGVDLHITKTDGVTSETPGTTATYTVVVTNDGPATATGVSVTDTPPLTGVSFTAVGTGSASGFDASGTGSINDAGLTLPAGDSVTYTLTGTIAPSATGDLVNSATVTSPSGDGDDTSDNTATDSDTLVPSADLTVTKSGPANSTAGDDITYTINLSNAGPSDASTVSLTDAVPAGTTFVSVTQLTGATFTCSNISDVVTCTVPTFAPGSASFSIVVHVSNTTATGTVITNTATASTTTADPTPGANNNTSTMTTTITGTADLSITKEVSPDRVSQGDILTYTIVATNNGPGTATGVVVTDPLPGSVTLIDASSTQGTCSGSTTVTCNVGTLVASAFATITIHVTASEPGTSVNTASVGSNESDANGADNSSGAAAAIVPVAVPTVSSSALLLMCALLAVAGLVAVRRS